jgi:hypothetical protein
MISVVRRAAGLLALAVGAAGAVVFGWAAGCNVYNSSLLLPKDAGNEGSTGATCARATYPTRPDPADAAPGGTNRMVAAMQSLDVGLDVTVVDGGVETGPLPTGPLPPLGWDLDNACTCHPDPPSCVQAPKTPENCDDSEGRDHTGLELFRKLGGSAQMSNAAADEALMAGQYGLVVTMSDYNGTPDDYQVTVALYFSSGVLGTGDGGTTQLAHDGSDKWTVDPRSIAGGPTATGLIGVVDCDNNNALCQPSFVDVAAYVRDNILVASLGDVPITFGGRANLGGAVMELSQTILVGTLVPVSLNSGSGGTAWGIANGSVSGRWSTTKLLTNMATIPDPTTDAGEFLCGTTNQTYQLLKSYICSLQDIPSNSMNDRMGSPCDAISMSFGFTAEPARLGLVSPLPAVPMGCVTGGLPFHDTCN